MIPSHLPLLLYHTLLQFTRTFVLFSIFLLSNTALNNALGITLKSKGYGFVSSIDELTTQGIYQNKGINDVQGTVIVFEPFTDEERFIVQLFIPWNTGTLNSCIRISNGDPMVNGWHDWRDITSFKTKYLDNVTSDIQTQLNNKQTKLGNGAWFTQKTVITSNVGNIGTGLSADTYAITAVTANRLDAKAEPFSSDGYWFIHTELINEEVTVNYIGVTL